MKCLSKESKSCKIIAGIVLFFFVSNLLPAESIDYSLRTGKVRLDHYLSKADLERSEEKWKILAKQGMLLALDAWEKEAANSLENFDNEEAEQYLLKEIDKRYIEWKTQKFLEENVKLERSIISKKLNEAASVWNFTKEDNTETRILLEDEASAARIQWQNFAGNLVNEYAVVSNFSAEQILGLNLTDNTNKNETEAIIEKVRKAYQKELENERQDIIQTEANELLRYLLYDQYSLRKDSDSKSAAMIATALANETNIVTTDRMNNLFANLETVLENKEDDMTAAQEEWLRNFNKAMTASLEKWDEAEESFLIKRSEWERDAYGAFEEGKEAWDAAQNQLLEKRNEWTKEILQKYEEGRQKWILQENLLNEELTKAYDDLYINLLNEKSIKDKILETQVTIYNTNRQILLMTQNGIDGWFTHFAEKYKGLYSYWKTESDSDSRQKSELNAISAFYNQDQTKLTEFEKQSYITTIDEAKNLLNIINNWKDSYIKAIKNELQKLQTKAKSRINTLNNFLLPITNEMSYSERQSAESNNNIYQTQLDKERASKKVLDDLISKLDGYPNSIANRTAIFNALFSNDSTSQNNPQEQIQNVRDKIITEQNSLKRIIKDIKDSLKTITFNSFGILREYSITENCKLLDEKDVLFSTDDMIYGSEEGLYDWMYNQLVSVTKCKDTMNNIFQYTGGVSTGKIQIDDETSLNPDYDELYVEYKKAEAEAAYWAEKEEILNYCIDYINNKTSSTDSLDETSNKRTASLEAYEEALRIYTEKTVELDAQYNVVKQNNDILVQAQTAIESALQELYSARDHYNEVLMSYNEVSNETLKAQIETFVDKVNNLYSSDAVQTKKALLTDYYAQFNQYTTHNIQAQAGMYIDLLKNGNSEYGYLPLDEIKDNYDKNDFIENDDFKIFMKKLDEIPYNYAYEKTIIGENANKLNSNITDEAKAIARLVIEKTVDWINVSNKVDKRKRELAIDYLSNNNISKRNTDSVTNKKKALLEAAQNVLNYLLENDSLTDTDNTYSTLSETITNLLNDVKFAQTVEDYKESDQLIRNILCGHGIFENSYLNDCLYYEYQSIMWNKFTSTIENELIDEVKEEYNGYNLNELNVVYANAAANVYKAITEKPKSGDNYDSVVDYIQRLYKAGYNLSQTGSEALDGYINEYIKNYVIANKVKNKQDEFIQNQYQILNDNTAEIDYLIAFSKAETLKSFLQLMDTPLFEELSKESTDFKTLVISKAAYILYSEAVTNNIFTDINGFNRNIISNYLQNNLPEEDVSISEENKVAILDAVIDFYTGSYSNYTQNEQTLFDYLKYGILPEETNATIAKLLANINDTNELKGIREYWDTDKEGKYLNHLVEDKGIIYILQKYTDKDILKTFTDTPDNNTNALLTSEQFYALLNGYVAKQLGGHEYYSSEIFSSICSDLDTLYTELTKVGETKITNYFGFTVPEKLYEENELQNYIEMQRTLAYQNYIQIHENAKDYDIDMLDVEWYDIFRASSDFIYVYASINDTDLDLLTQITDYNDLKKKYSDDGIKKIEDYTRRKKLIDSYSVYYDGDITDWMLANNVREEDKKIIYDSLAYGSEYWTESHYQQQKKALTELYNLNGKNYLSSTKFNCEYDYVQTAFNELLQNLIEVRDNLIMKANIELMINDICLANLDEDDSYTKAVLDSILPDEDGKQFEIKKVNKPIDFTAAYTEYFKYYSKYGLSTSLPEMDDEDINNLAVEILKMKNDLASNEMLRKQYLAQIKSLYNTLAVNQEKDLNSIKGKLRQAEADMAAKQNAYNDRNSEYNEKFEIYTESINKYNSLLQKVEEKYQALEKARLQYRKDNELYEWAENTYLRAEYDTNVVENFEDDQLVTYETPQEKLTKVKKSKEAAELSFKVLRTVIDQIEDETKTTVQNITDKEYNTKLEAYEKAEQNYYVISALAEEVSSAIKKQKDILYQAETAALYSLYGIINPDTDREEHKKTYEIKDEILNYIYITRKPKNPDNIGEGYVYSFSLRKKINFITNEIKDEEGKVIQEEIKSNISNVDSTNLSQEQKLTQKELFKEYLNSLSTETHKNAYGKDYQDRQAQLEVEQWLRDMNSKSKWNKDSISLPGNDYLSKVVIAALYLEYMGITNNKSNKLPKVDELEKTYGAFKNILDEEVIFKISTDDKKTHGINYFQKLKDFLEPTLKEIFDEVDEDDVAKYLLYKDNYISSGLNLEARAQQYLHLILFKKTMNYAKEYADKCEENAIALGIAAAAYTGISFLCPWILIEAAALAILAGTEATKANDTKDLIEYFNQIFTGQTIDLGKVAIRLKDGIQSVDDANKTVKQNREYLNLLTYGNKDISESTETKQPVLYKDFKTSITKALQNASYIFTSEQISNEESKNFNIQNLFKNLIAEADYNTIAGNPDGSIPVSIEDIISNILTYYRDQMNTELEALDSYTWGTKDNKGNYTSDDSLIQTKLKDEKDYNDYVLRLINGEEEIITTAEKPEDTTEGILLAKALKAWGLGTFRSKDYYEDRIAVYKELDKDRVMYNRGIEGYLYGTRGEDGKLAGSPGVIDSYIQSYMDALDAEIQLKLELKKDENQRLLDDLAEQKSNWYTQMSYIISVATAEWEKAKQRINNDQNNWEKEFIRVYDNKIEEWNQTYRDFSESKATWVKEQYMKASQGQWEEATAEQDINRENIIQEVFLKTGLISKINDAVQNMAEETDSYIQGLTSSAIFKRSLEVAGSITDNIGAGIKHTKQGNTINTQNDTWLKEALESSKELEEHYEKISAKLTEQQMADQLRATIDGYMAQIDARNEGMRDWEESLVLQNGYSVNGNTIQREIIIDSTLTKNIKKTQSVYAYENFRVARPEQEISAGGSEDGKSLIESILDGIVNVKKWAEKIFGKAKDAKGNPVERTITKTKAGTDTRKNMENNNGQQLLEDYLKTAKEYDDNQADLYATDEYNKYKGIKSDIEKKTSEEYKDWAKNNEEDNETYNKVSRQITQIQDGAINEWIGYAPTLKEGEEFKINKSKWENIEYEGKGQMGLIMLDFQWNSIEEQNGLAELAKPMYDKKMWDDDGAWLQPPTVRSIADIALDIVGDVTGQKWLSWVDDAIFGLADVSGGYKTVQEVGLELGKKALTQVVSSKIGNATEWAKDAAGTALKSAGTAANVAAQAGISVASSYASSVTSSAINSFNIVDGELKFDSKNFTKSLYSSSTIGGALGAGLTAGLSEYNLGTRKVDALDKDGNIITDETTGKPVKINEYTRAKGLNSAQIENMGKFNSLMGGLASSAVSFAMDGEATFNLINISDFGVKSNTGLFELTVGKKGVSSRIGTGGTNISIGNIKASINGGKAAAKSGKINSLVNKEYGGNQNIADALRMQYGFGDQTQNLLLNDILNGKAELIIGETDGRAQTVLDGDIRKIYLNESDVSDWQLAGLMLGHEAYRNGILDDTESQLAETRAAVAGHTDIMKKMLDDSLYSQSMAKLIGSNQNLTMDYIASSLGEDIFNSYIDLAYESSADYWKLLDDGSIKYDGRTDLYMDVDGEEKYIYKSSAGGIEGSLVEILYGKNADDKQTENVRKLMVESGLVHTHDENNPYDQESWYWNRTGTVFDPEQNNGYSFAENFDADTYNKTITISSQLLKDMGFSERLGDLVFDASDLSKNYISNEVSYNYLKNNKLNLHGMRNMSDFIYSKGQIENAQKIRNIANENAANDDWEREWVLDKDGKGDWKTFCNFKVGEDYLDYFGNPDEFSNIFIYNRTLANAMGRAFANLGYTEITSYNTLDAGFFAQLAANQGDLITASFINTELDKNGKEKSGHVATVISDYGIYDPRLGPKISQVGMSNGEMYMINGFGKTKMAQSKYYKMMSNSQYKSYMIEKQLMEQRYR